MESTEKSNTDKGYIERMCDYFLSHLFKPKATPVVKEGYKQLPYNSVLNEPNIMGAVILTVVHLLLLLFVLHVFFVPYLSYIVFPIALVLYTKFITRGIRRFKDIQLENQEKSIVSIHAYKATFYPRGLDEAFFNDS